MTILIAVVVTVVWPVCAWRNYQHMTRQAYWEWPDIWTRGDWGGIGWFYAFLGPAGFFLIACFSLLGNEPWLYPPIPRDAVSTYWGKSAYWRRRHHG